MLRARSARAGIRIAAAAALLAGVGCATPVGVERVDARDLRRELAANAVSTGEPSAFTRRFLRRQALDGRFEAEPELVLAELHADLGGLEQGDRLLALAELSFLHADDGGDRSYYRAALLYAFAFLFRDGADLDPFAASPRFALGIYNRALPLGLVDVDDGTIDLSSRTWSLPFGALTVETDPGDRTWGGHRLESFFSTDELRVRGLRNRYRSDGIGAPLGAVATPVSSQPGKHFLVAPNARVPITALLLPEDVEAALRTGDVRAHLEVYTFDRAGRVRIDGREVRLAFDSTATLAQGLETSTLWDFELAGFLGRLLPLPERDSGLFLMHPYRPGRVPVVLVHGTASSPARWAELVNEIRGDPDLAQRVQLWLFIYNTGNPILYSGHLLRQALREATVILDPLGRDPALRQIVVIGHSQGGLLTKLQVVDPGDRFWSALSDEPFDAVEMSPESRDFVEPIFFFEPVPQVRRVVYIATPHRGSFLVSRGLAGLAARLIRLPADIAERTLELTRVLPSNEAERALDRTVTAVDNMSPRNNFIRTLSSLREVPDVAVHSIIPVRKPGPPEGQTDGVVAYDSAHLEDADSERVVRSGHSTQGNPFTIAEVKRILRLHLGDVEPGEETD